MTVPVERCLRAAAAVVAGLQCAVEHLRGDDPELEIEPMRWDCPFCTRPLKDDPHVHPESGAVVWPTETEDVVLVTDPSGAYPVVLYRGPA